MSASTMLQGSDTFWLAEIPQHAAIYFAGRLAEMAEQVKDAEAEIMHLHRVLGISNGLVDSAREKLVAANREVVLLRGITDSLS